MPGAAPDSFSLRRRLLLLLLGTVALAWVITALWSYFEARHEIEEIFDAQLAQSARVLLAQAHHEPEEIDIDQRSLGHKYERKIAFQVWEKETLVLRSASAPPGAMANRKRDGYNDVSIGDRSWRVLTLSDPEDHLQVQVGERRGLRDELARNIVAGMLFPLLIALPLLALLIWIGIGRGLSPLGRLAADVATRAPGQLMPVDPGAAPREVRPLVVSLNTLFARVQQAFDSERRFTADAAHELRTPLAALKIQAQVALGAAGDAERHRALENVIEGVDRATHLVEELLTLARLDPQAALGVREPVDLGILAAECIARFASRAMAKSIELRLERTDPLRISGDPGLLAVLLGNFLDNAIRYSPAGSKVTVRCRKDDGTPWIEVEDAGPGIPPEHREKVFERFYRVLGTGETGSGLGLSIARRIAELHGAMVRLEDSPSGHGLRVSVTFPAHHASGLKPVP